MWRRSSLTIGNLHIEGGRPSFCNGGAAGCSKKPNPPVAACAVIIRMANWSKRLPVRTCFNSLIFNTAIPQICVIKQSVDLTGLGPVPSRRYLYLAIDQDSQGGPPTTANSRPSLAAASQKRWLVSSSKFKYIYIYSICKQICIHRNPTPISSSTSEPNLGVRIARGGTEDQAADAAEAVDSHTFEAGGDGKPWPFREKTCGWVEIENKWGDDILISDFFVFFFLREM